jgi:hypothetical protein
VAGVPGATAAIRFRFPRSVFVTGFQIVPRPGTLASLVPLAIRIQDESSHEMIFDWQGARTAAALALQGIGGIGGPGLLLRAGTGWTALQRPVAESDQWFFTLTNRSAGDIIVACVLLQFEEGLRRAA